MTPTQVPAILLSLVLMIVNDPRGSHTAYVKYARYASLGVSLVAMLACGQWLYRLKAVMGVAMVA